jgi:cyclin-dependent kinase 12/13
MGTPLFRGAKDPEQLEKIFEKCGVPNDQIWPGVSSLPNYNSMMPKTQYTNCLNAYYRDCKKYEVVYNNLGLMRLH